MATDLKDRPTDSGNRNLPGSKPEHRMPFTNTAPEDKPLTPEEAAAFKKIADNYDKPTALEEIAQGEEAVSDPVSPFYQDLLDTSSPGSKASGPQAGGFRPTLGRAPKRSKGGSQSDSSNSTRAKSEATKMSDILDEENQNFLNSIKAKKGKVEGQKVGRWNIRGRARKKVRVLALGAVFAIAAAVPIGILGAIPHAMQSWVQNKVSEYTEHAVDKMGQRVLYTFIRDRVAIDKCKGAYNSGAEIHCRPRLNERDTRLSQLFNDWHAAKMEQKLYEHGINVEYDPNELLSGGSGKPYKITIDGEDFKAAEDFGSPDWDISTFAGKRETSISLRKEMKAVLKEDTKWWQYLKRRNMKAGYLRDLGLPGHVFPSKKVAKVLDTVDALKLKATSEFRQYLTRFVVNHGNARVGALLEILLSGESSKATPAKIIENNKALRAAALKLGDEKVAQLLEKFAGKNLQEIEIQIVKDLIAKLSETMAEKFGQLATDAIPVIGWVLLAFTVLDALDLATDGTLQHWLSGQNAQAMMDVTNLMDTTVSEERRGYVDVQSAGDMRLSLINGLGSSRVFSNMIGYKSPDGKQPAGYSCRPDVSISNPASLGSAIEEIFDNGDPTNLKQAGMADDQQTCENHRVDYDPMSPLSGVSSFIQNGFGPFEGLAIYTEDCSLEVVATFGLTGQKIPGCPSIQAIYHGAQGGVSWVLERIGINKLSEFVANFPPIKAMMSNVTGWMSNGIAILITGQSLAGPELLQGGMKTDSKSGARLVDAWVGGGQVANSAFMKGVGDGGGLGGIPLSPDQAATLNETIAAERREELADSSFFDRMFDISHVDTAASGLMGMAVMDGGFGNFINPVNNLALAFGGGSSSAAYADAEQGNCRGQNKKGQAVTEFGVICYGIPDSYIDSLTEDQMQDLADPALCETKTAELDSKRKEAEDSNDESRKDPDGSGTSTEIDGCRIMGTTTDTMGTNFRTGDKIFGFDNGDGNGGSSDGNGGASGAIKGNTYDDNKCAEGSRDASSDPVDGYSGGDRYKIRLCVIEGFKSLSDEDPEGLARFNSTVSASMVQMFNDAKSGDSPVTLEVTSSFRSNEKQQQLRDQKQCPDDITTSCPGGAVGRVGYSNHQMGFAFDISQGAQSASWQWMRDNSDKYGYKWFGSGDVPHFSTTGG